LPCTDAISCSLPAASALAASLPGRQRREPGFYARARSSTRRAGRSRRTRSRKPEFHLSLPVRRNTLLSADLGKPTKVSARLKTAGEQTYEWPAAWARTKASWPIRRSARIG